MSVLVKALVWLLRAIVFVALFGLALKNSGPLELRLFLDQAWTVPVSVALLAAFALGVAIGLTAAIGAFFRSSRDGGSGSA